MRSTTSIPPRVAVSGGAGFIGSHVVEELDARGWRVLVVDDLSHAADAELPAATEVVVADCGGPAAAHALRRFAPAVALHLAAGGGVLRAARDPGGHVRRVLAASVAFITAARDAGARRIVAASSGGALYGDAAVRPTPETTACRPRSAYGAGKLAEEAYLGAIGRAAGTATLALRFGNVYGPRQDGHGESGVVAITSRRLLAGLPPVIRGDGLQTRDFVFVGDVARATAMAVGGDVEGELNVGTGRPTAVRTVVEGLLRASGASIAVVTEAPASEEVRHGCLAVARIAAALGWRAEVELDAGLAATYSWFAGHPAGASAIDPRRARVS